MNDLLDELVQSKRYSQMVGRVNHFATKQQHIEREDLIGEFNRGLCVAVQSVKMNIGDPMEYLLSRGYRHVQHVVQTVLNHETLEECLDCGKSRPYRPNPCYTCNGKNFLIHPRYVALTVGDGEQVHIPTAMLARWRTKLFKQAFRRWSGCRKQKNGKNKKHQGEN